MSIARAFTTKRNKRPEISAPVPQHPQLNKLAYPSGSIRHMISGPVELVSTTNMLSYNAPDIYQSKRSSNSGSDSDNATLLSSPPTSPDNSSIESSPCSPEPNHLSCYFGGSGRASTSSTGSDAPKIPSRAPSHTKRSHERLSCQRSVSKMPSSTSSNSITRSSINMFSAGIDPIESEPHPFGNELAQVSELAEEFGGSMEVIDEEEQELIARGLFKFCAEDYMLEIQPLFNYAFLDRQPMSSEWI